MKTKALQAFKRRTQVVSLIIFAWASIVPVQIILAKSHRLKNQPVVKVGVYNYAGVVRLELRVAECQAAALLAEANVRIAWSEFSGNRLSVPSGRPAPDFSVRILDASRIFRSRRISDTDALGQSVMAAGSQGAVPGRIANVFYDRVEHVSSLWGLFRGDVLGVAIAHELGHLLGTRHSSRGLMKSSWTSGDLKLASRGQLRFSPGQIAALQLAARSLQKGPSLTLAAQR